MIAGILSLLTMPFMFHVPIWFVLAPTALAISIIAYAESNRLKLSQSKKMAATGMITSFIGLMLFAIFIRFSVSEGHKHRSRAVCQSNLKQIGLAMKLYADDNDGQMPSVRSWQPLLSPYMNVKSICICPTAKDKRYSYGMNKQIGGMSEQRIDSPSRTVAAFDCSLPSASASGGRESVDFRHSEYGYPYMANIVFMDGHASTVAEQQTKKPEVITIDRVLWKP